MELNLNYLHAMKDDIDNCLNTLVSGGIILYPTDTIWGIGCDATNSNAIQKIYQLKKREEKKSLIILVSDEHMIHEYVNSPSPDLLACITQAQKPTTAIFSNAKNLPSKLINEDGTIAIRIAKDSFCNELICQFKIPIVSTSANISGEKSPENFTNISEEIKNGVDYIVKHRQNDFSKHAPSSIIKMNSKNEIEFIR